MCCEAILVSLASVIVVSSDEFLHFLKTGCGWRDVPSEYGPATTIYNRYNRWSRRGFWQRQFEQIAPCGDLSRELRVL
jgi:hypothetical protein